MVKNPPAMQETQVQSLGWGDPLEKGMATPPSILAWKISCGGLQSMGSQSQTRLSDRATDTFAFRFPMVGTLFFPLYPPLWLVYSPQSCLFSVSMCAGAVSTGAVTLLLLITVMLCRQCPVQCLALSWCLANKFFNE